MNDARAQHSTTESTVTSAQLPDMLFTKGPLRQEQQKVRHIKERLPRAGWSTEWKQLSQQDFLRARFQELVLYICQLIVFSFFGLERV